MMFSKEDFKIGDTEEFLEFLPIFVFIALIAPLVVVAYKLGFVFDKIGWLDTKS
ncbi:MAG: hypothetical protein NTV34_16030 [Proteobacteria bacterium]|nr:hypothetical protein [Pseudomonadota bacterium]